MQGPAHLAGRALGIHGVRFAPGPFSHDGHKAFEPGGDDLNALQVEIRQLPAGDSTG